MGTTTKSKEFTSSACRLPLPGPDRIIVKPVEVADRTKGGIALPEVSQKRLPCGTVMAIGPEASVDVGPTTKRLMVGDRVYYFAGVGHMLAPLDKDNFPTAELFDVIRVADVMAFDSIS